MAAEQLPAPIPKAMTWTDTMRTMLNLVVFQIFVGKLMINHDKPYIILVIDDKPWVHGFFSLIFETPLVGWCDEGRDPPDPIRCLLWDRGEYCTNMYKHVQTSRPLMNRTGCTWTHIDRIDPRKIETCQWPAYIIHRISRHFTAVRVSRGASKPHVSQTLVRQRTETAMGDTPIAAQRGGRFMVCLSVYVCLIIS